MSVVPDLKQLVAMGKTREAIGAVLELTEKVGDNGLYNQAVMLSSKFNALQRENNMGILTPEQAGLRSNQITNSLLYVLDQIDEATPGKLTYVEPGGQEVELSSNTQGIRGTGNMGFQDISGGTIHVTVYNNAAEKPTPAAEPPSSPPSPQNQRPMEFAALAGLAVTTLAPLLKKGASAAVEKAGESIWNFMQKAFTKERDKKKLEELQQNPEDPVVQGKVAGKLEEILEDEPGLMQELKSILDKVPEQHKTNTQNISGSDNIGMQDISGSSININK